MRGYHRGFEFLLLAATVMFTLTGCASGDAAGAGGRKFGASYMTMNNPFYVPLNNAIRDEIEANGDILITLDPALDQEKQIEQIKDLISEGIQVLFLTPVDWKGVKPALEACREAGVLVINVDAPVFDEDLVACVIASDNYSAGVLCARDMTKRLPKGNIAVITHPGAKSGADRIAGFDDIVFDGSDNYAGIGRMDSKGQLEIAMPLLESLLKKNRDIDAVMALNDPSVQGAVAALNSCGFKPGEVLVYGVDGSPDVKRLIQDGWVTGTAAQSPIGIGEAAADAAYQLLSGEAVEREITVPVEFISAGNIGDFDIDGWQ